MWTVGRLWLRWESCAVRSQSSQLRMPKCPWARYWASHLFNNVLHIDRRTVCVCEWVNGKIWTVKCFEWLTRLEKPIETINRPLGRWLFIRISNFHVRVGGKVGIWAVMTHSSWPINKVILLCFAAKPSWADSRDSRASAERRVVKFRWKVRLFVVFVPCTCLITNLWAHLSAAAEEAPQTSGATSSVQL